MPKTKISEPKYQETFHKQVDAYNKGAAWISEMVDDKEKFPGFSITIGPSTAFNRQIDYRDMVSMGMYFFGLEGATEEEQKKHLQENVYKMQQAFQNGPVEEALKYIDGLFDLIENFDEENLNYEDEKDVFKAISVGAMNQCIEVKRNEFKNRFNERYNTPELLEKYYYAHLKMASETLAIYNESAKYKPLNIIVSIPTFIIPMDDYTKKFQDDIVEREVEQYEKIKSGSDEIVPLNFELGPDFNKAVDGETSAQALKDNLAIFMPINMALNDAVIPGGTEGKTYLEGHGIKLPVEIFVNGDPILDYAKKIGLDVNALRMDGAMTVALAKALMDPTANIDFFKPIPLGNNEFKISFIPIHRDYKNTNPALQAKHDEAFKAYVSGGNKEALEKETAFIQDKMNLAKVTAMLEDHKDMQLVGAKGNWNPYDPFYEDNVEVESSIDKLFEYQNALNYFNTAIKTVEPDFKIYNDIEARQSTAMAMFFAGKNGDIQAVVREKYRIHQMFKSEEGRRSLYRELAEKVREYDLTNINYNEHRGLYYHYAFASCVSALSNAMIQDKVFEEEMMRSVENRNDLAVKVNYCMGAYKFLGDKILEKKGQVPFALTQKTDLVAAAQGDTAMIQNVETEHMDFDLGNAKVDALYTNKKEASLHIPYFFAGNIYGMGEKDFSSKSFEYDFDDYMLEFSGVNAESDTVRADSYRFNAASIRNVIVSTAHSFYGQMSYAYELQSSNTVSDFAKANGIEDFEDVAKKCIYIDGRSLSELMNEKIAQVCEDNGMDFATMGRYKKSDLSVAVRDSIIAEALANPKKTITQVFLGYDKDNCVVPKPILLKKDYSSMVAEAATHHSKAGKFFHWLHLYTYAEEKLEKRNAQTNAEYVRSGKSDAILNDFMEKNNELLLKEQAECSISPEKKKEALRVVDPEKLREYEKQEKTISNLKNEFKEKVEVEKDKYAEPTQSRPNLDTKISKISVDLNTGNHYDDVLDGIDPAKKPEIEKEDDIEDFKEENLEKDDSFDIHDIVNDMED